MASLAWSQEAQDKVVFQQLRVHPSGCQVWSTTVLATSPDGQFAAFCSTMAIFVFDISVRPVRLRSILAGHDKNIYSLTWSPHDPHQLVSGGVDGSVIQWSIKADTDEVAAVTSLPHTSKVLVLDWDPIRPDFVAMASGDGAVLRWHVSGGQVPQALFSAHKAPKGTRAPSSPNSACALQWNPKQLGMLLVAFLDGSWLLWDDRNSQPLAKPKYASGEAARSEIVDVAWDPLGANHMIIAYKVGGGGGVLVLWDAETQEELNVFERQPLGVQAVMWLDWAPGSFLTVNKSTSVARVWNVSQKSAIDSVRLAGAGVDLGLLLSPGGVQGQVGPNANRIHSICPVRRNRRGASKSSQHMLIASNSGRVGLWNWRQRRFDWTSPGGHTETIFDCTFAPGDPNLLATSSYDGSVVIWDTPSMTILSVMHTDESKPMSKSGQGGSAMGGAATTASGIMGSTGGKGTGAAAILRAINPEVSATTDFGYILYSVCWSPNGTELAAGSVDGKVHLFDLGKGKQVQVYDMHARKPCYKVDWFPMDLPGFSDGLLASSGRDCEVAVFSKTGRTFTRFRFDRPCYGCHWNPRPLELAPGQSFALLATGCHDGSAYVCAVVLDALATALPAAPAAPLLRLPGHSERVFHTAWSPLVPCLLATGSDDTTVRVWDLEDPVRSALIWRAAGAEGTPGKGLAKRSSLEPTVSVSQYPKVLRGHTNLVRPVTWSSELPWLLLSSGWDSTICAWDIRSERCLGTAQQHLADVYGLVAHPERPFVYISCSRDTTLRTWSLTTEGGLAAVRLESVLTLSLPPHYLGAPPSATFLMGEEGKTLREGAEDGAHRVSNLSNGEQVGDPRDRGEKTVAATAPGRTRNHAEQRSTLRFCGHASRRLAAVLQDLVGEDLANPADGSGAVEMGILRRGCAEAWQILFNFWDGTPGAFQLFHLAGQDLGDPASPPRVHEIMHHSRLLEHEHERAMLLESSRMGLARRSRGAALLDGLKRDDALLVAADIHLKCGHFEDTCRLLSELGLWTQALALAPAVSRAHWCRMMDQYAKVLEEHGHDAAMVGGARNLTTSELASGDVAYHLASGQVTQAVGLLLRREQFRDAILIAAAHHEGRFTVEGIEGQDQKRHPRNQHESFIQEPREPPATAAAAEAKDGGENKGEESTAASASLALLQRISSRMAIQLMGEGEPVLAACSLLAVGDPEAAVLLLARGNEFELALGVALCYAEKHRRAAALSRRILPHLAVKAQRLRLWKFAVALCDGRRHNDEGVGPEGASLLRDQGLLCALCASDPSCDAETAAELYSLAGLDWGGAADEDRLARAQAALTEDADDDDGGAASCRAAQLFLLARDHSRALAILLGPQGPLWQLAQDWDGWRPPQAGQAGRFERETRDKFHLIVNLVHALDPGCLGVDSCGVKELMVWACWLGACLAQETGGVGGQGLQSQGQVRLGLDLRSVVPHLLRRAWTLQREIRDPAVKDRLSDTLRPHRLMLAEAVALLDWADHDKHGDQPTMMLLLDRASRVLEEAVGSDKADRAEAIEVASMIRPQLQQMISQARQPSLVDPAPVDTRVTAVDLSGPVCPCGTNYPGERFVRAPRSILDDRCILGAVCRLEDAVSCVSKPDAIMWTLLNPFSPLTDGTRTSGV